MGKSQLQAATVDWQKRVAKYSQAGIPQSVWQPIVSQDLNKTYTSDSTPMTNAEADTAIYSAWKGKSAVNESPRHSGGFFGDLSTIASNIIPDVGNIITGLPRGIYDIGKAVVTPSTWSGTAKDLSQALGSLDNPGQAIRDVAKSPLLDLIPGVNDIADLTTSAGRTQLMEHPVTAALDVLPLTKPLSAAAGLGLAAEGSDVARATEGATLRSKLSGKLIDTQTDPSATAALAAGKTGLALTRALDRNVLTKFISDNSPNASKLGPGQRLARKSLEAMHLDAKNIALNRAMNHAGLIAQQKLLEYSKGTLDDIYAPLEGDPAALVAYSEKERLGDTASMSPAELSVFDRVAAQRTDFQDRYTTAGDLRQHDEGLYPKGAKINKQFNARDKAAKRVEQTTARLTQAQNRLLDAKDNLAQAQNDGTVSARHGFAVTRANNAITKATTDLATHQKALTDANTALNKKMVSITGAGVPAHLHEWVHQDFRKRVIAAIQAKADEDAKGNVLPLEDHVPVAGAMEANITSQYARILQDAATTPFMDRFYEYIGKKETKALFADSVNAGLKLSEMGLTPMYSHVVRDTESVMHVHHMKEKDAPESQVKQRALSMTSSIFNSRASLTEEMKNIQIRDAMKEIVYPNAIKPHEQKVGQLLPAYMNKAKVMIDKGKVIGKSVPKLAQELMEKEWSYYDLSRGIREGIKKPLSTDTMIPKSIATNLASFQGTGRVQEFLSSDTLPAKAYNRTMKVFRVSVLYGPRHAAHVIIGGMMPVLLDDPVAMAAIPKLFEPFRQIAQGKMFTATVDGITFPRQLFAAFNYKTDSTSSAFGMLQTKVGDKYGNILKQVWEKSGANVGKKLEQWENLAQSLYQGAVYFTDIKKGVDPIQALEHARKVVVNLDDLGPAERTIFKQIFPFYSFTRFATKFLVHLPYDHPLRVAILSQLSNQAQEEWGTGLPQTMMSLFFIGHTDAAGNISTINLRNMNPFRSISNQFTIGGFLSSLNPILSAPFTAAGFNTLDGTGELYPQVVYDAATGNLTAARPKSDWLTALSQFTPELGAIGGYLGISDNLRTLKSSDPGAFHREVMSMLNIPFAWSQYNIPQVRGKTAEHAYQGAQLALSAYKKSGDYSNTIGRYNLIPYNGSLIAPSQFAEYWQQLTKQYSAQYPGADVAALIPKLQTPTTNTLAELEQYYGGQQ